MSKIELKQYHPETIQYGKNGRKYIPLPDEFLLTEEEAVRGEGNPRLYQSDSFQKAATYILYQIYYGNITPYGYTYDKAKQRVKKLEMFIIVQYAGQVTQCVNLALLEIKWVKYSI